MTDSQILIPARSSLSKVFRRISRNLGGLVGAIFVFFAIGCALFAPLLTLYDPTKLDFSARLVAPTMSWTSFGPHPLGTDQLGRDIWARLAYGGRTTLAISVCGVLLACLIGVAAGLAAGYRGGFLDRLVMRVVDVQLAFPIMLLALMVVAAVGPNALTIIVVLALTGWARFARVIRGEVLSLRSREFVVSAEAAGARPGRILFRHILPNTMASIVVLATLELARFILMESSLSFLGVGVQPPAPSWGRMLAEGRQFMETAWWLSTLPGVMIVVVILGVSFLGDWMRGRFDPKMQGRK